MSDTEPLSADELDRLRALYADNPDHHPVRRLLARIDALTRDVVRARSDLHAALCEGAFRIDRDPMEVQGILAAVQDGNVSTGWARDALRRWMVGLPVSEVPDQPDPESATALQAKAEAERDEARQQHEIAVGALAYLRESLASLAGVPIDDRSNGALVERLRAELDALRGPSVEKATRVRLSWIEQGRKQVSDPLEKAIDAECVRLKAEAEARKAVGDYWRADYFHGRREALQELQAELRLIMAGYVLLDGGTVRGMGRCPGCGQLFDGTGGHAPDCKALVIPPPQSERRITDGMDECPGCGRLYQVSDGYHRDCKGGRFVPLSEKTP